MWEVMRYRTAEVGEAGEDGQHDRGVAWCDPRCRSAGGGARPTKAIERI